MAAVTQKQPFTGRLASLEPPSQATVWISTHELQTMSKARFRALFVLVPALVCSIIPSIIFGLLADQWGTNLLWGSYFGLGWCLSAFWSGNIVHDRLSTIIGLVWGWGAMIPLFLAAGWLWERLTVGGRRVAVGALAASALLIAPAKAMMRLDQLGVHLPDYTTHLATSY